MVNLAIRAIVRVKKTLMRAVLDTAANIFIVTLPIVKKLRLTMGMPDESKIIAIDQIKKNIIRILRDAPLLIQDTRAVMYISYVPSICYSSYIS